MTVASHFVHQVIVQAAAQLDANRATLVTAVETDFDAFAPQLNLGTWDPLIKPLIRKQLAPLVNAGINYLQKQAALPPATSPAAAPAATSAPGINF